MKEEEKREALQNIEFIKELVLQTKKHVGNYGGGWISIIWGVFCFVGVGGQRLLMALVIRHGALLGVWWTVLALVAGFGTYLVHKRYLKSEPIKLQNDYLKYFMHFWIPLMILGYTLAVFIALLPALPGQYISVVILLVVSTGYIMIGLMFFGGILYMGIIGYVSSIVCAIFFLDYSDIILGTLFGVGLIITGLVINKQWKNI
jgi:hypothetical protein